MFAQFVSKLKREDKNTLLKKAYYALSSGNPLLIIDDLKEKKESHLILSAEKLTIDSLSLFKKQTTEKIILSLFGKEIKEMTLESPKEAAEEIKSILKSAISQKISMPPPQIFRSQEKENKILTYSTELAQKSNLIPAFISSQVKDTPLEEGETTLLTPAIFLSTLIETHQQKETLVRLLSQAKIPTNHGSFKAYAFESLIDGTQHLVLVKGKVKGEKNVLVRIHSECLTGDVFSSKRCDCGAQRDLSLKKIAQEKKGIFIYLKGHEGRGIGLGNKLQAYQLQERGLDTVEANLSLGFPADIRKYKIAAEILSYFDVHSVRLLTNNLKKCQELETHSLTVSERVPLNIKASPDNLRYLSTKKEKLGHLLDL